MKIYQDNYYKAKYKSGSGESGDRTKSLEAMREAIDKTNEHYKANGYKQEQFVIVNVQWGRIFDDDGIFISEHSNETRIEIYPATLAD